MDVGILSMRYAKAMIEYAQEKDVEDRVYQEFVTLSYCFRKQPALSEALDNPIIPFEEKVSLICTAADGEGESSSEFVRFITMVLKFAVYRFDVYGFVQETETYRNRKTHNGCPCKQGDGAPYPFYCSAYIAFKNGTGNGSRPDDRRWIYLRY